jgi:hypothetical protein
VGAVGEISANVEAEVYFLEGGVEGRGNALEADAGEEEADERDVAGGWRVGGFAVLIQVELEAAREVGCEEGRWRSGP